MDMAGGAYGSDSDEVDQRTSFDIYRYFCRFVPFEMIVVRAMKMEFLFYSNRFNWIFSATSPFPRLFDHYFPHQSGVFVNAGPPLEYVRIIWVYWMLIPHDVYHLWLSKNQSNCYRLNSCAAAHMPFTKLTTILCSYGWNMHERAPLRTAAKSDGAWHVGISIYHNIIKLAQFSMNLWKYIRK